LLRRRWESGGGESSKTGTLPREADSGFCGGPGDLIESKVKGERTVLIGYAKEDRGENAGKQIRRPQNKKKTSSSSE